MLNHSSYHRVRSTAAAVAVLLSAGAVVVSCDSSDPSSPAAVRDVEILVDSASLDVREGETVDLKATVVDADGNPVEGARIEWASSNPEIAEVTPDGRLTARQAGRVELTASSFGRIRDFWAWIRALPKSISIVGGNEQEGTPGEALSTPLVVYVVDRKGDPAQRIPVTFRVVGGEGSVSPASGKTDGQGRISARWTLGKPGEQRLEARVHPEYAKVMSRSSVAFTAIAQESKTEEPPVSPGKVTISVPADTMLEIGATATLQAVARDAEGILIEDADIQWSSSNPDIMTVDDMGRVVAKAAGAVLITAAAVGCTSDTQRMVVEPPPVEAQNPAAVTDLAVGDVSTSSVTLRWTAVSDGAGGVAKYAIRYGSPTLNWGARYETEVSVSADSVGERMTYRYGGLDDGTQYQFRLVSYRGTLNQGAIFGDYSNSVSAQTEADGGQNPQPAVASVTATPGSHTFTSVGQSRQIEAVARDSEGNIVSGADYTWASTNSSIASVNTMGVVTARGAGTAMVIVSSVCCGAADSVTVEVRGQEPPPGSGDAIFTDGFESGSLSGVDGGRWYNAVDVDVTTERARSGSRALKFTYQGNSDLSADAWSEIRGEFSPQSEIWLEWYLYVPSNYEHRDAAGSDNNKFWIVGYNNNLHGGWQGDPGGWTVRMELNPARGQGNLSATRLVYGNETSGASSSDAAGTGPAMSQYDAAITNADRGTWVRFGVHLKLASSIRASDGEVHFYKNGVRVLSNANFPIGGTTFTKPADSFELMGWANSGFDEQTVFFVDDVRIWNSNPGWE